MIGCNYWREHAPFAFLFPIRQLVLIFLQMPKGEREGHHVRIDSQGGCWQVNECELAHLAANGAVYEHRHASAVSRPGPLPPSPVVREHGRDRQRWCRWIRCSINGPLFSLVSFFLLLYSLFRGSGE